MKRVLLVFAGMAMLMGTGCTPSAESVGDALNRCKLVGGYTIRYFVDKMSPPEKAEFLKKAGFKI
ncbi:DUF2314 domain-containing protein [Citrifermentans bremense]|uniref:DUF2314 domain-containing protein n=1 Tax=Citrifermentans bremense TaxID=60035 RepID=UPI00040B9F7D|nr:DUF2314 domain-containing protein [Citrifermentans bremense]